jgi:nucleotidyltransferase/DNA polymerase involved in DNA repair
MNGCRIRTKAGVVMTSMIACVRGDCDFNALYRACARLTPRIERHPDALVLDLSGCERLMLGDARSPSAAERSHAQTCWPSMARALYGHLRGVCPGAASSMRLGLAPTRTAAWLAALPPAQAVSPPWRVLLSSQVSPFLSRLPLDLLTMVPGIRDVPDARQALDALSESGIMTLGQLARIPVAALVRRFGPLGSTLAAIATGQDATALRIPEPPVWIGARFRFDPPTELAGGMRALAPLARYLAQRLHQQHVEASTLSLTIPLADGCSSLRAVRHLNQPTASSAAILDHAERLLLALADKEQYTVCAAAVHLRVGDLRVAAPRQDMLWTSRRGRDQRAQRERLLAIYRPFAGRQGAIALLRTQLVAPHAVLPEARYALRQSLAA